MLLLLGALALVSVVFCNDWEDDVGVVVAEMLAIVEDEEDEEDPVVDANDEDEADELPSSANIVPKVGTKVDEEQQLPSYAQHHDPDVVAASHAITLTAELFPAISHQLSSCRETEEIQFWFVRQ